MNAEAAKLNSLETLGGFWRSAYPVTGKIFGWVSFAVWQGEGAGAVSASPEQERQYARPLVDAEAAEQERERMLARVNARTHGMWGNRADALILSRQQLGKAFRVWRSAPRPRAVKGWRVERYPVFNRLKYIPGLFQTVAVPELLKVQKANAEAVNYSAAYLFTFSAQKMSRIRSSSPRWRGSTNFKRARYKLKPAQKLSGYSYNPFAPKQKALTVESILNGMTPKQYALNYWKLVEASKGKEITRSRLYALFIQRFHSLAKVSLLARRELIEELKRLKASKDTYAGYAASVNPLEFFAFIVNLIEELPEPEQLPRPPDLIPVPPSAPLAPPV